MNWVRVNQLLVSCRKQISARCVESDPRLRDYLEFLSSYDGAEGFLSSGRYIVLWSALQVRELNDAYRVADFAPGVRLIGTDGGDTFFGIDETTGRYVSVPIIGMSREALKDEGGTFEEFLQRRASPC
jgi:hypothetical protein